MIGINEYVDWPTLEGGAGDARRIAAAFREIGFDDVIELYDREATRARILQLLGEELARDMEREDQQTTAGLGKDKYLTKV